MTDGIGAISSDRCLTRLTNSGPSTLKDSMSILRAIRIESMTGTPCSIETMTEVDHIEVQSPFTINPL